VDDRAAQRAGQPGERPFVAAWLLIVAGLCIAVAVWGTQISGILSTPAPAARVATSPGLDVGALFQAPSTAAPRCIYIQNNGGTGVFISVKTGSLLSEAQVKHCTK
jgi:hypothetical protein